MMVSWPYAARKRAGVHAAACGRSWSGSAPGPRRRRRTAGRPSRRTSASPLASMVSRRAHLEQAFLGPHRAPPDAVAVAAARRSPPRGRGSARRPRAAVRRRLSRQTSGSCTRVNVLPYFTGRSRPPRDSSRRTNSSRSRTPPGAAATAHRRSPRTGRRPCRTAPRPRRRRRNRSARPASRAALPRRGAAAATPAAPPPTTRTSVSMRSGAAVDLGAPSAQLQHLRGQPGHEHRADIMTSTSVTSLQHDERHHAAVHVAGW